MKCIAFLTLPLALCCLSCQQHDYSRELENGYRIYVDRSDDAAICKVEYDGRTIAELEVHPSKGEYRTKVMLMPYIGTTDEQMDKLAAFCDGLNIKTLRFLTNDNRENILEDLDNDGLPETRRVRAPNGGFRGESITYSFKNLSLTDDNKNNLSEVTLYVPIGTSSAKAIQLMSDAGFTCKLLRNEQAMLSKGDEAIGEVGPIDFIWCDKHRGGVVACRWKVILILDEQDNVADHRVKTDLIGP